MWEQELETWKKNNVDQPDCEAGSACINLLSADIKPKTREELYFLAGRLFGMQSKRIFLHLYKTAETETERLMLEMLINAAT